jgi:hypothetical protein
MSEKLPARLRQTKCKGEHDYQEQSTDLRQSRDVLDERAPLESDVVERSGEKYRRGRDVVYVTVVRCNSGVTTRHTQHVLGEGRRNCAQSSSANENQLSPSEKKSGETTPRLADVDVDAAGLRKRARYFCERQRAAEREQAAGDPDHEERKWAGKLVCYAGRRTKNSRTDRRAD